MRNGIMDDTTPLAEQAYALFVKHPRGLFGPDTLLLMLQNKVNEALKVQGLAHIILETAFDLKNLPEPVAQIAIDLIKTLPQMSPPNPEDIAGLL